MSMSHQIAHSSGVSKRLFRAMEFLAQDPCQMEDALFQLAAVIDSTSKFHFPSERSSKKRFGAYLDKYAADIIFIASNGTLPWDKLYFSSNGMFLGDPSEAGLENAKDFKSFGELIYSIRCCAYHDPNEIENVIKWGRPGEWGLGRGRFVVTPNLLNGLFIVLFSDEANTNHIDRDYFPESAMWRVDDDTIDLYSLIGNRRILIDFLKRKWKR